MAVAMVVVTEVEGTAVGMEAVATVVAKVAEVRAADLVEVAREEASVVEETEAGMEVVGMEVGTGAVGMEVGTGAVKVAEARVEVGLVVGLEAAARAADWVEVAREVVTAAMVIAAAARAG